MAVPEHYPPADRTTQWRPELAGGATFTRATKLVLHSTESAGWPAYPDFAPHLTYDPWTRQWRQHLPLNRSASTLADPSSTAVRENRDDVLQVEIVGYADKTRRADRQIAKLPAAALADLGALVAWMHRNTGLPLAVYRRGANGRWQAYPDSYGARNPNRMSSAAYDAFAGILGHQHVSGNDHGDPGDLDVAGILAAAQAIVTPPVKVKPKPVSPAKQKAVTYVVGVTALRGRTGPSTTAKVRWTRKRGFTLSIVGTVTRGGIVWGFPRWKTYYALAVVKGGKTTTTYARKA